MQKNITFSADETIIRKAREKARKSHSSLNIIFRQWLTEYATNSTQVTDYNDLMKQLNHIKAGKIFSRDEMNER